MKKLFIIISILVSSLIIGCSQQLECPECPKVECTPCPPCPELKEVTKYVCQDNTVVDNKEDCATSAEQGTAIEDIPYNPVTTNEEGTYISSAIIKVGCYRGMNAAVMSFNINVLADKIKFQVKENLDEEFKTVYEMDGVNSASRYAVICDSCYSGDFQLKKDKQYLARIEFDLTSLFNTKQYSNEHIVDTRETSDYMTRICSS